MGKLNKYFVIFASVLVAIMLAGSAFSTLEGPKPILLTSDDSYELTDPMNALNVEASAGVLSNDDSKSIITGLSFLGGLIHGSLFEGRLNNDGSFVYITNEGQESFHGVDYFEYIASAEGYTDSAITRVVIGVNDTAPVAVEDRYATANGSLAIANDTGVLTNDSDSDLDSIYTNLVQDVHAGILNLNSDGSFDYTSNKSNGVDFFQYQASDLFLNSNTVYSIFVIGTNTNPSATADTYVYDLTNSSFEANATEGVLTNDSDADGDTLFARLVDNNVQFGTLDFDTDGSFKYTPDEGTNNVKETFTYYATDLDLNSETVTVSILVNYTEPAPVVVTTTTSSGGRSGSGGQCITKWTVGEWSACENGVQTRTVSYPANFCKPTDLKPSETQTCTNSVNTNSTETDNQTNTTGFFAGITGAVIGALGSGSFWMIIGLIILLIAGYLLIRYKRKQANIKKK